MAGIDLEAIRRVWRDVIVTPRNEELATTLSPLEYSALHSCIPDCFESFHKIYDDLLPALAETPGDDHAKLHDLLYDIGGIAGELEHIREHIQAARKGFDVLLRLLADQAAAETGEWA